jgi:endonuclease/exonuclease/phosphatase family metal-dependent hydrolase
MTLGFRSVCAALLAACFAHASAADTLRSACADDVRQTIDAPVLRVLTLNASHGRNTAVNQVLVSKKQTYANLDAIAEVLSLTAADVVALQEADAPSIWSGKFDHVAHLADRSGYGCIAHGLHSRSWMSTYGTALLSSAELHEPASIRFQPSPPSKQKGYVSAQLLWRTETGTRRITVASVHFDFLRRKTRDGQVAEMVAGLSRIDGPLVVLGDLNSEWHTEESHVQRLSRELDLHAFEPEQNGLGTYKKPTGKRLDWILVSRDLEFRRHEVLPDVVADHFAVFAELAYRGQQE